MSSPLISLLTDFGLANNYVGVMKGVMNDICPEAKFVDISHQIRPQQVQEAAYELLTAVPYFRSDTVHLIVVDPGVGSTRRAVGVETDSGKFIAPDNGVLTYVLNQSSSHLAVELTNPDYMLDSISTTFHGRDIFSPAAAHLAAGVPLRDFGPLVDDLITLPAPELKVGEGAIVGEIIGIDHFGNAATSIKDLFWTAAGEVVLDPIWGQERTTNQPTIIPADQVRIQVNDLQLTGLADTFSAVSAGEPLALVGSDQALDLALNQGNLAEEYHLHIGDQVELFF